MFFELLRFGQASRRAHAELIHLLGRATALAPTLPAATWTFCSRSALTTSAAVRPAARELSGSSHKRIAKRAFAEDDDVADAGHALERVAHVAVDVVADEQRVVLVVRREEAERAEKAGRCSW